MSTIIGDSTLYSVYTKDDLRASLSQPSPAVAAQSLLGCRFVTPHCTVQIVETEAYSNADDPASHAHRGRTDRNQVMYGRPGLLYMYFNYGNHWMANVVCCPEGQASAVLLRAAMPVSGTDSLWIRRPKAKKPEDLCSGPGKLAAALGLDRRHYGIDLLDPESPIHLSPGEPVAAILQTVRVGLAPGRGDDKLWRYIDAERVAWVSRPRPQ